MEESSGAGKTTDSSGLLSRRPICASVLAGPCWASYPDQLIRPRVRRRQDGDEPEREGQAKQMLWESAESLAALFFRKTRAFLGKGRQTSTQVLPLRGWLEVALRVCGSLPGELIPRPQPKPTRIQNCR